MATDLAQVEANILAQLQTVATLHNVSIGRLDAGQLNRPVTGAQLFVDYSGFTSDYPFTNNNQELRTYSYRVYLRMVNLQTHDMAYPILAAVNTMLRDFKPLAKVTARPMRLLSEKPDLSQVADGLWVYVQIYDFQILEV